MKQNSIIISIFILPVLIFSCSKKEYTEEGIHKISHQIDSLLYSAVGENFDWGSSDSYSSFSAYFSDSTLIFINERLNSRSGGESINWYYVYENRLIQFVQKKIVRKKDNNKSRKSMLNLTIQITPSGDVLNYDKIVDGRREELTGTESGWIYSHSKELINIVKEHSKILKKK